MAERAVIVLPVVSSSLLDSRSLCRRACSTVDIGLVVKRCVNMPKVDAKQTRQLSTVVVALLSLGVLVPAMVLPILGFSLLGITLLQILGVIGFVIAWMMYQGKI